MSNITISTAKYAPKYKEVEIDGVNFKVRNLGAGDQLDISQASAEIMKCQKMSAEIDQKDYENQAEILAKITAETEKITAVYYHLFDDGTETGEKTKELFVKIGFENVPKLLMDIFEA